MTVALTGGTGFIGARLAERLVADGVALRCLVRRSSDTAALEALGVELAQVDLERGEGLEAALAGCDAVLHLAGVVRAWDRATFLRVNAEATRALAAAARRAGVGRFQLVSSLAAAGPSPAGRGLEEHERPAPIVPYGESKLAAERALAEAAGDALTWSVVRPSIVYGPGDRDVFELFKLARRRFVPYAAPPGARLSFIHVDDLVELLLAALARAPHGQTYFASDGVAYGWDEVVRAIGAALGRDVTPVRVPPALVAPAAAASLLLRPFRARPPVLCLDKLHEARQPGWLCSPEKARRELGFAPRVTLAEGVRATAEWYRAQGWL